MTSDHSEFDMALINRVPLPRFLRVLEDSSKLRNYYFPHQHPVFDFDRSYALIDSLNNNIAKGNMKLSDINKAVNDLWGSQAQTPEQKEWVKHASMTLSSLEDIGEVQGALIQLRQDLGIAQVKQQFEDRLVAMEERVEVSEDLARRMDKKATQLLADVEEATAEVRDATFKEQKATRKVEDKTNKIVTLEKEIEELKAKLGKKGTGFQRKEEEQFPPVNDDDLWKYWQDGDGRPVKDIDKILNSVLETQGFAHKDRKGEKSGDSNGQSLDASFKGSVNASQISGISPLPPGSPCAACGVISPVIDPNNPNAAADPNQTQTSQTSAGQQPGQQGQQPGQQPGQLQPPQPQAPHDISVFSSGSFLDGGGSSMMDSRMLDMSMISEDGQLQQQGAGTMNNSMNFSGNMSGNMSGNLSGNMNQSANFNQSGSTMRSQQPIPVAPGSAQKKNRQNQSQTSSSLGIKKVVKKDFSRVHLTKVRDTPTGLALLPPGFLKDSGNYSPRNRETEVYTPKRSPRMDSSRRMDGGASFQNAASTTIGGHSISQTHTMTNQSMNQNFGGEASTFYSGGSGMVGGGLTRSVVLDSGGVSGGVQSQSFQNQAYQTGMSTTSSRTLQDSRGNDLGRGGGSVDAGDSMTGGDSILSTNRGGPSKFKLASDYNGIPSNSGDLVQYGLNDPVKRSPYDNAGAFLFDDPNSPVVKSLLAGEIVEVEAFGGQPLSQLSGGYSNFNLNAGVSSGSLNMGSSMDMEAIHGNRHHFSDQMDGLVGTSPSKHQAERKALPYLSSPRAAAAVMPPPQTPPVEGEAEGKAEGKADGSKAQSSANASASEDSANKIQKQDGNANGSQAGSPRSVANFPPVTEFGAVISPRDPIPVIQSPRRLNETGSSFASDMNNPVTAALNHLAMRSRVDGHSPNSTRSPFRSPGDAVDTEEEVDGVLSGRIADPTSRIPVSFGGGVGGPNSTATGSTGMRATNASMGVVSVMSHAGSNSNLSNAHMNSTGMNTVMNTGMGSSGMGVNTMMHATSMSTGRMPGSNPGHNMMSTTLPSMGGQIAGNSMNSNTHSNNPFAVNSSHNNSINFTNTVASGVSGGSQTLSGGNISGGNSFHGSHTGSQGGLVAGSSTTRSVSFLNGGNSMQSNGSENLNGGNSTGSAAPTFYGNSNHNGSNSNTGSTTLGNTNSNTGTYGTHTGTNIGNNQNLPNTSVPVLSPNTETNPSGHLQDSIGDEGYLQFLQIKKEQENRNRQKQKQREDEESARKQRATQRRTGVVPGSGNRNANASSGYREGKHEQGLQHSNSALNNSGLGANANDQVDQHLRAVASHKQRAYMEALGSEMWDQNHLSQNGHATNQQRSRANSKGSSRGIGVGGGVGSRGNSMNTSNSNIIISNPSQVMGASSQPLVYVGNSQNSQNSSQQNPIQVPAGPGILMPSQIELSQSQQKLPRVVPKY